MSFKIDNFFRIIHGLTIFFVIFSSSAFINASNLLVAYKTPITTGLLVLLVLSSLTYGLFVREYFVFTIAIIITAVIYLKSGSKAPLVLTIFIFSTRGIDPFESLFDVLIAQTFLLFGTMALWLAGVLQDVTVLNKHSLGFYYPNTLGATILSIIIVSLVLYEYRSSSLKAMSKKLFIFAHLVLIILLWISGARGSMISSVIAYAMFFMVHFLGERHGKFIRALAIGVVIGVPLASIVMLSPRINQVGSVLYKLNSFLTTRIQLNYEFFINYGVKFFGQHVQYLTDSRYFTAINRYAFLDNAYIMYLINFGIVSVVAIIVYELVICSRIDKPQFLLLSIPLVAYAAYGFVEQGFAQYWVNVVFSCSAVVFRPEIYSRTFKQRNLLIDEIEVTQADA
ncbi:O-antigen ligase family protein [Lactiplantibacillus plantarum]|uniref:O-antigen ligase family protein n=1 Tax=Lactiplantibacillus plantarum TaxID=1590 RepID=UPI003C222D58